MSSSISDCCLSWVVVSLLVISLLFCQFLVVSLLELLLVSGFFVLVSLLVIFALLLCLVFAVAVVVVDCAGLCFCGSIGVSWVFHLQNVSWFLVSCLFVGLSLGGSVLVFWRERMSLSLSYFCVFALICFCLPAKALLFCS